MITDQSKLLFRVYLLGEPSNGSHAVSSAIAGAGLSYELAQDLDGLGEVSPEEFPTAVLIDLSTLDTSEAKRLIKQCHELKLPVLAIVPQRMLGEYDPSLNPDEFIASPINRDELVARLKQAIFRVKGPTSREVLKVGELVIDLEKYDVTMSGRRISLTYKEFQLLVLLASNPGRVYTRDVLLSQVWGYAYLGGTRTVDVHIRRLRSKIEDPDHSFIETIWNVGYRFKSDV